MQKHNLTKGVKMIHLGAGMYCPKSQYKEVQKELEFIYKTCIKKRH